MLDNRSKIRFKALKNLFVMNRVIMDFPERFQSNAFCMWFEKEGFEFFQKFYGGKMPTEPQPSTIDVEYDEREGISKHFITIE